MFIPLGAAGERVRKPVVTLALIALNVVVYVLTQPRVIADENRLAKPGFALQMVEGEIEMRHRGGGSALIGWLGLEKPGASASRLFWWRWERGLIVRTDDPEWVAWNDARDAFRRAHHTTLFYEYGFKRDDPTVAGLACHGFLHAGFEHLLFNMLFLWAVGVTVEDSWGRKWFLLLYVTGLVGSAVADFVFMPKGLDIPGVGASGAIAAVMGAMAVRHFRRPMRIASLLPVPGYYTVATGWLLVPWIVLQVNDLVRPGSEQDGIGFSAHVGGFLVGAALAAALRLGGVEAAELAPARERERLHAERLSHEAAADAHFRRSRTSEAIVELQLALAAEPDDLDLRRRIVDALGALGRTAEQREAAAELLQRLWRAGERDRFASAWEYLETKCGPLPATLAHRVAPLQETRDPAAAAGTYARALTEAPGDPLASQSFKRYAELLDRMGEPEKAARVRELRDAHERRKRDATLR